MSNGRRRRQRRRRFIIRRQKNLFITPRPALVCSSVSIWCKFPMWIAWHALYNGLNDSSAGISRDEDIQFFFFFTRSWRFKMYKRLAVYIGTYFEHPPYYYYYYYKFPVLSLLNYFQTSKKKKKNIKVIIIINK